MKTTLRTLAVAGLAALGLAACETVGGLGQDIEKGGEAITGASNEAERELE